MLLNDENKSLISGLLLRFSDPAHVDECEWSHDPENSTFEAVFIADRFAKCLVIKKLLTDVAQISEDDLQLMAKFASAELERLLDQIGMMSAFNASTGTSQAKLPEGFTLEVIYEDEETDPYAPGINWQAIA
jgi:hypothetical protein